VIQPNAGIISTQSHQLVFTHANSTKYEVSDFFTAQHTCHTIVNFYEHSSSMFISTIFFAKDKTNWPAQRGLNSKSVHILYHVHIPGHNSKINAEGLADFHYKEIFRLHSVSQKIYSDRGSQFAARFMQALYKRLSINTGFTTAYHPQGNSKVERKNKEVEQYLCLFCHKTQDNWVDYDSLSEYEVESLFCRTVF
jgi:hypothetical protein